MTIARSMPYEFPPIVLLPNAADAAGRASLTYVNLRNALKAWVICEVNQGNAATVQLTPLQATAVAGTGSKAIAAQAGIWLNNDTSLATGSDKLVAQTAAANFTTDATLKDKLVIFEIVPEEVLDLVNGFHWLGVSTGASNVANITSAAIVIWQGQAGASAPTTYV